MPTFFKSNHYSIDIQDEHDYQGKFAPQFTVNIHECAINKSYEALAQKFKQPINGVSFKVINNNLMEIAITFNAGHQATDKTFRETLATFNRYKMTMKTSEEILKQYEKYVEKYAEKLDLPARMHTQHYVTERSGRHPSCT